DVEAGAAALAASDAVGDMLAPDGRRGRERATVRREPLERLAVAGEVVAERRAVRERPAAQVGQDQLARRVAAEVDRPVGLRLGASGRAGERLVAGLAGDPDDLAAQ